MSFSIQTLERAARLVRAWGATRLANGQTLAETLTVEGISWWDVAAPNLAAFYLPPYLSGASRGQPVKAYLSSLKYKLLRHRRGFLNSDACGRWPPAAAGLVLGFSPYIYRDVLQPVVEEMQASRGLRPMALHDASAGQAGRKAEFWHSVWHHWDADVARQALSLGNALKCSAAEMRARGLAQTITDGDEALWAHVKPLFDWLFVVYFPRLVDHAAVAQHLLRRHRPAVILSADVDDARNRLYCMIGRQEGIPSLELQFGMCGSEAVEWQFFVADRLAVWGEQARDVMIRHGVPEARIAITGSPRHDRIASQAETGADDMRTRLGILPGKVAVLFASVHSGLNDRTRLDAVKQAIFRAAADAGDLVLIVKPHPGELAGETERLARNFRNVVFADKSEDIRTLITQSDAFVTLGSTATLDALLARKTVIWPALEGLVWWDDHFINSGAALVVRSEQELAAAFRAVADRSNADVISALEPARRRFLDRWVFRSDGHASKRIVALMNEAVHPS